MLGIPTHVTTKLEQVQPVQGSVTVEPNFNVHIRSTTSALLRIKRLRLGLLSVPATVPHGRAAGADAQLRRAMAFPLVFDGTTTIPRLTGCGLLGPTLGTRCSRDRGNAYT